MTTARCGSLAHMLVLALALVPRAAQGQFRAGANAADTTGWAPAALGVHVGFDNAQSEPVVGARLHIPVLPSGAVELLPNVDVTFFPHYEEYQANFELVYVSAGRRGGIYAGGGVGFRNGPFSPDPDAPRRNERTLSLMAGVRLGGLGRIRPEVETRWIFQDELVRDPRLVVIGVSLALW